MVYIELLDEEAWLHDLLRALNPHPFVVEYRQMSVVGGGIADEVLTFYQPLAILHELGKS